MPIIDGRDALIVSLKALVEALRVQGNRASADIKKMEARVKALETRVADDDRKRDEWENRIAESIGINPFAAHLKK